MATTTPNYGWTVPTSTDLVKDGATAIETLGDAVDATVYANANAAIAKSIVDAKGDLIAATAADTVARLASSGVNDQVLTIDTSTATGLKWASVAAGPVQLATVSLSGVSTYTFSSISGAYKSLLIQGRNLIDGSQEDIGVRINGSTDANYQTARFISSNTSINVVSSATLWGSVARSGTTIGGYFDMYLPNYASTNATKTANVFSGFPGSVAVNSIAINTLSTITSAAITSITINNNAVNWTSGTLTLYGVN